MGDMTFVITSSASATEENATRKTIATKERRERKERISSLCSLRSLAAKLELFVMWLALTPALSPEERVGVAASWEDLIVTIAIAAFRLSAGKTARQPGTSAAPKRGERFSFSSPSPIGWERVAAGRVRA